MNRKSHPSPLEKRYLHRTLAVALGFTLIFGVVLARLYYLQRYQHDSFAAKARRQHSKTVKIAPQRGMIFSSNNRPLAASRFMESAYLAPEHLRALEDSEQFHKILANELARCLVGEDAPDFRKRALELQDDMTKPCPLLSLKGQYDTPFTDDVPFSGTVQWNGTARLEGVIDKRKVVLTGRVAMGEPTTLKGLGPGGVELVFQGNAASNRNLTWTGDVPPDRTMTIKGRLGRRPDFYLARKISQEMALELVSLREEYKLPSPAIYFVDEGKREYPGGELAAHVLGYTTSDEYGDNVGLAGAEMAFGNELSGAPGRDQVEVTVLGTPLSPVAEDALTSAAGHHVYLTINDAVQQYAEQALASQVEKYNAKGGVCVVLDIPTGGVLAMASWPGFDPNDPPRDPTDARLRNRCLVESIQPGSVMKLFTATTLLENNLLSPFEMINCYGGVHQFPDGRTIKDSHHAGIVPVHEAFAESSNVAFAQLGMRLDKQVFHAQLETFGFGRRTGMDLPGEGSGILHAVEKWGLPSRVSIPIGYEITLTPVQVAAAAAAIVNNGHYMQPHVLLEVRTAKNELVRPYPPRHIRDVCSPQTSRIMLDLLEEVVTQGTGKDAAVPGYRVGGKTGTTVKAGPAGGGEGDDSPTPGKRYYASFIGVIPIEKPRLVIYSWIDEPQGEKYGGTVAAPIFRMVAEQAVRMLGIEPSSDPALAAAANKSDPSQAAKPAKPSATPAPALAEMPAVALPDSQGVMPDLTGLTMLEAASRLQHLSADAQMVGWGVAVRQQPAPGTPLEPSTRGLVVFGPPNP